MRFESLADMPQGMRKKVVPKMLMEHVDSGKMLVNVKINGIEFKSCKTAERFLYLLKAADKGLISGLRLGETITVKEEYCGVDGVHHLREVYASDFSYTVADFDYIDGFKAGDLATWEAISEQATGKRVYEFHDAITGVERAALREKNVLFLEMRE